MSEFTTPLKRCNNCGNEYPATPEYFYRDKYCKDGFQRTCQECQRHYNKVWRKKNPELELIRARKSRNRWIKNHPEYRKAAGRRYAEKHREQKRQYQKRYRDIRGEKENTRKRIWIANHPAYKKLTDVNRRARKRALPHSFSPQDWNNALAYFNNRCAACGRPIGLWHTLAADHWIPLADVAHCPGTVPTNIVPLCHGVGGCNNKKGNRNAKEWAIDCFGKRRGMVIFNRITQYFDSVRKQAGSLDETDAFS